MRSQRVTGNEVMILDLHVWHPREGSLDESTLEADRDGK